MSLDLDQGDTKSKSWEHVWTPTPLWGQGHSENQMPAFAQDKKICFTLVILAEILFLCVCISCQPSCLGDEPHHDC